MWSIVGRRFERSRVVFWWVVVQHASDVVVGKERECAMEPGNEVGIVEDDGWRECPAFIGVVSYESVESVDLTLEEETAWDVLQKGSISSREECPAKAMLVIGRWEIMAVLPSAEKSRLRNICARIHERRRVGFDETVKDGG
jgi:hypothetical protein